MESTHLYKATTQQPLQGDDPEWREALTEALRRREMDRKQEREREGERTHQPQRYKQQSA